MEVKRFTYFRYYIIIFMAEILKVKNAEGKDIYFAFSNAAVRRMDKAYPLTELGTTLFFQFQLDYAWAAFKMARRENKVLLKGLSKEDFEDMFDTLPDESLEKVTMTMTKSMEDMGKLMGVMGIREAIEEEPQSKTD